jgi:hypothetical protein
MTSLKAEPCEDLESGVLATDLSLLATMQPSPHFTLKTSTARRKQGPGVLMGIVLLKG